MILNNSTPIAKLLNERFTQKDGYRELKGLDGIEKYEEETMTLGRGILRWIMSDVYENALDKEDGSREYFKQAREAFTGCELKNVTEVSGGGEEALLTDIKENWRGLRERMRDEDGAGELEFSLLNLFLFISRG